MLISETPGKRAWKSQSDGLPPEVAAAQIVVQTATFCGANLFIRLASIIHSDLLLHVLWVRTVRITVFTMRILLKVRVVRLNVKQL